MQMGYSGHHQGCAATAGVVRWFASRHHPLHSLGRLPLVQLADPLCLDQLPSCPHLACQQNRCLSWSLLIVHTCMRHMHHVAMQCTPHTMHVQRACTIFVLASAGSVADYTTLGVSILQLQQSVCSLTPAVQPHLPRANSECWCAPVESHKPRLR